VTRRFRARIVSSDRFDRVPGVQRTCGLNVGIEHGKLGVQKHTFTADAQYPCRYINRRFR